MRAIEQVLAMGKGAIMLVPEIALTKQIVERFIGRFGKERIAVMHSKLTGRERFDEWMRIRRGEARIVIGARIGVFAPMENIGAIILDEEHEATYKSDQTPKYETLDVAVRRLMHYHGVLLLGSATPSVVSYQRAKEGIYSLLEMKHRYNAVPLPVVEIVDMRKELRRGNRTMFSNQLYHEMKRTLAAGEQVILFLNRRGYSTFIACKECGEVLKCPECGISLVYHKRTKRRNLPLLRKKIRSSGPVPVLRRREHSLFRCGNGTGGGIYRPSVSGLRREPSGSRHGEENKRD